jgi:ferric-dicitrate binding protein FerR (iron transport regulator)
MSVTVTGTEFSVRAYDKETVAEVALFTGGVNVSADNRLIALTPNMKLSFNRETGEIVSGMMEKELLARYLHLPLEFSGEPLREVLQSLGRYFELDLNISAGLRRADEKIYIVFDSDTTPDNAMALLSKLTSGFSWKIEGNTLNITP